MSIHLEVQRAITADNLPSDGAFQSWAELALQDHPGDAELCIRLVNSDESQQLNRNYRGKDKPTNVLSFPFEPPPGLTLDTLGDIAICTAVVEQEAQAQHKALQHHYAHLVIHGILHLLGYDHINDTDAQVMESKEIQLLSDLGIPNPYLPTHEDI